MSTSQIITQAIGILLIVIMFFGLVNAIYEFYYLGKKSPLTADEMQARKTLKLILFIPVFLLFVTIFIGLLYLLKFLSEYDIMDVIFVRYNEMWERIRRVEVLSQTILTKLNEPRKRTPREVPVELKQEADKLNAQTKKLTETLKDIKKLTEKPKSSWWSRAKKMVVPYYSKKEVAPAEIKPVEIKSSPLEARYFY